MFNLEIVEDMVKAHEIGENLTNTFPKAQYQQAYSKY